MGHRPACYAWCVVTAVSVLAPALAQAASEGEDEDWVDWLLGTPLRIAVILLIATVVTVVARWLIRRFAQRFMAQETTDALDAVERTVGVGIPRVNPQRVRARTETFRVVLTGVVTTVIWVIAFVLVLAEVDVDLGPLIAGAGIVGIALGFGAQTLVRDYLAGIFIIVEDQFGVGDVVDLGEATGTVEEVTLRATVLRDVDGVVWHVSNGSIIRVGNQSKVWARARVDVSVAYDTDIRAAMVVILDAARALAADDEWADCILEEPEMWGIEALEADGVTLRLMVKTLPGAQFDVARELHIRLKEALDEAGIEIPFPQRTTWIRDDRTADP